MSRFAESILAMKPAFALVGPRDLCGGAVSREDAYTSPGGGTTVFEDIAPQVSPTPGDVEPFMNYPDAGNNADSRATLRLTLPNSFAAGAWSIWFLTQRSRSSSYFWSWGHNKGMQLDCWSTYRPQFRFTSSGGTNCIVRWSNLDSGGPHSICITYDGVDYSGLNCYLNGSASASSIIYSSNRTSIVGAPKDADTTFDVGHRDTYLYNTSYGQHDRFLGFKRVLSAAERVHLELLTQHGAAA